MVKKCFSALSSKVKRTRPEHIESNREDRSIFRVIDQGGVESSGAV